MESEKVKEIKKALECMSGLCKDSLTDICFNCEVDKKFDEESACKEALTLINELEFRIGTLEVQVENLYKELKKEQKNHLYYRQDSQFKESRIAELEKKDYDYRVAIGNKALNEVKLVVLPKFAERLKEKVIRPCDLYDCVALDDIDETLKEFVNGLI